MVLSTHVMAFLSLQWLDWVYEIAKTFIELFASSPRPYRTVYEVRATYSILPANPVSSLCPPSTFLLGQSPLARGQAEASITTIEARISISKLLQGMHYADVMGLDPESGSSSARTVFIIWLSSILTECMFAGFPSPDVRQCIHIDPV